MEVDSPTVSAATAPSAGAAAAATASEEMLDKEAKSILAKMVLKAVADPTDAPLTTKAVRDLQKAQKERVFNRTLIKVRYDVACDLTVFI